jgi:hypothetical protein
MALASSVDAFYRVISPGSRSGRSPRQAAWRSRCSPVNVRHTTSPTRTGRTAAAGGRAVTPPSRPLGLFLCEYLA